MSTLSATAEQWRDLLPELELETGDVTLAQRNGHLYAIYDTQNGVTVSDALCTHAGANLCDGYFDGRHIECPLHQGLFDATTGVAKAAPVHRALRMYECRLHEGMVQIRVADKSRTMAR